MYVDLWRWFREYEHMAFVKDDASRRQLVTLAREGWRYREVADADSAIRVFEQGVRLAEEYNEPCWVIFHKYWVAEMLFYLKHDYQATLDYTIRLTAECRKEIYDDCPVKSRVFFVLANIYYMIDFYGYEEKIIDVMDYVEDSVPMDEDTHLRLLHMRAQIDFDHQNYDACEEKTLDMLNRSLNNAFRQRSGYHLLRAIAYARGDIALASEYNEIANKYAKFIQIQRSIAEGKLWDAIYALRLGEVDKAQTAYNDALEHYEYYDLAKEVTFHEVSSEYMELLGKAEQAIEFRRALIEQVSSSASIYNQMLAHWNYCRILGRFGKPMETALASARSLGAKSLNPSIYLQKLDEIEAGEYWEYAWQKED